MNESSQARSTSRLLKSVVSLVLALSAGAAAGATYFKCVDAKGAVTVQQTACVITSSQEERKVWASRTPLSQPAQEPSSPQVRPAEENGRARPR